MRYYFVTRHTLGAIAAAIVISGFLMFFRRLFVVNQESDLVVFSIAVPLQICAVGALSLSLSGRTEQFEFAGMRKLWLMRLLNASLLTTVGSALAAVLSVSIVALSADGDTGTVGPWAPLRAFAGLFGVTLLVASFLDMRLAALCAAPLVLVGFAFDSRTLAPPFGEALGFVLADADSVAATIAAPVALLVGLACYVLFYSERNSPSMNRRALIDARRRMRGPRR